MLAESRYFSYSTPPFWIPVGILPYRLVRKTTRIVWLPDGEKLLLRFAVSIEYRRVTDRQTDILRQHSPRYA